MSEAFTLHSSHGTEKRWRDVSRAEQFLTAVDVLQSGRSLEVVGEHGSGRTHLLQRVRDHFMTMGWRVVEVTGIEAFRRSPLVALAIAGVAEPHENRTPPLVSAYRTLWDQVRSGRTIVVVDDGDALDEASWGVLTSVSARAHVPMVSSRLKHRPPHQTMHPTSGFSSLFTLELQPMSYAELESSLEELVQTKIEPSTMSRLFAKSGGTIGLAETIYSTALRGGRIVVDEDGVARAVGGLWLPALRAIADIILQPLEPDDIAALKTLALLGPADLSTALKVVAEERVLRLEERSFVTVVEAGEARLITVNPPLLVEHFRHDALPAQRAALLAAIDDSLAIEAILEQEETSMRDTAVLVRLIHERARLRTIKTREAWRKRPSLPTATQFLGALESDSSHSIEEVSSLFAAVRGLTGSESDRADWEIAYAQHVAHHHGRAEEGIELLRAAADILPSERERLLARAVLLEMTFFVTPSDLPLGEVDVASLAPVARHSVLLARAYWHLVRGSVDEATALLEMHDDGVGADPQVGALVVYAQLALGNFDFGYRIALERLREARAELDAPRIRVYAFLAALSALFARRYDDSEVLVADAAALGLPVGEAPISYIGLTLLSAYFAVRRGQRGLMTQYLAELDITGLTDGPLPGLQRSFVYSRLALLDGDRASAARVCLEGGDVLWERGSLFAAGLAYLDAVRAEPSRGVWSRIEERVSSIPSPYVAHLAAFSRAFVDRDGRTMCDVLRAGIAAGRAAESVHLARAALGQLQAEGSADTATMAELQAVMESGGPVRAGSLPGPELTPREREVAELVASGLSNPMIAEALVVSIRTVESHVNKLIKKIGAKRRQDIREYLLAIGNRA